MVHPASERTAHFEYPFGGVTADIIQSDSFFSLSDDILVNGMSCAAEERDVLHNVSLLQEPKN